MLTDGTFRFSPSCPVEPVAADADPQPNAEVRFEQLMNCRALIHFIIADDPQPH